MTVRHVSGDRVVAMVESFRLATRRAAEFTRLRRKGRRVAESGHSFANSRSPPPERCAPHGIHAAIWGRTDRRRGHRRTAEAACARRLRIGVDRCDLVEAVAVGETFPNMSLFLRTEAVASRCPWRHLPGRVCGSHGAGEMSCKRPDRLEEDHESKDGCHGRLVRPCCQRLKAALAASCQWHPISTVC